MTEVTLVSEGHLESQDLRGELETKETKDLKDSEGPKAILVDPDQKETQGLVGS